MLSVADPPRTNNPSLSPTCCVPGKVLSAPVISPLLPAVVTISKELSTVPFFLSLASNAPAVIVTAFNSVISSFMEIFKNMGVFNISILELNSEYPAIVTFKIFDPFSIVVKEKLPNESEVPPS